MVSIEVVAIAGSVGRSDRGSVPCGARTLNIVGDYDGPLRRNLEGS